MAPLEDAHGENSAEDGERRVRLPRARPAKIAPFMAIEMGSFAGLLLLGEAIVGGVLGLTVWLVKRAMRRRASS